jgi:hypothetical protein
MREIDRLSVGWPGHDVVDELTDGLPMNTFNQSIPRSRVPAV